MLRSLHSQIEDVEVITEHTHQYRYTRRGLYFLMGYWWYVTISEILIF